MATFTFFNKWKEAQLDGDISGSPIDFTTDTIKLLLVTASRAPVAATDDLADDLVLGSNEVSGTNYTARGDTIAMTVTETTGTVTVDGADNTWAQNAGGFTDARYAVLYKDSAVDSTSPLIGFIDFLADKGNVSGDLTVQWNALGIFTLV